MTKIAGFGSASGSVDPDPHQCGVNLMQKGTLYLNKRKHNMFKAGIVEKGQLKMWICTEFLLYTSSSKNTSNSLFIQVCYLHDD